MTEQERLNAEIDLSRMLDREAVYFVQDNLYQLSELPTDMARICYLSGQVCRLTAEVKALKTQMLQLEYQHGSKRVLSPIFLASPSVIIAVGVSLLIYQLMSHGQLLVPTMILSGGIVLKLAFLDLIDKRAGR